MSHFAEFDASSGEGVEGKKCYLPESIKLEWKRDQLVLNVAMQDVKVNQFDSSHAAALFVEPVTRRERVNLAELSRAQRKDSRNTVRQTMPSPPPSRNSAAKPGRPGSDSEETTMAPLRSRSKSKATTKVTGAITTPLEDLVSAPLPVGAESASTSTNSAGPMAARGNSYAIER